MRIALLAFHFAEYTSALAIALARQHDVLLVLNRENFDAEIDQPRLFDAQPRLQVCFMTRTANALGILQRAVALVRVVRGFRPDVLHLQEDSRDHLALALPFLGAVPMVLTVHDPRPHSGDDALRRQRSRHGRYLRQMRRRANAVIVHGDNLVGPAEQEMPWLRGAVHALPHGPLGLFCRSPGQTPGQPSAPWQPGQCLFFGRIEEYKGLPYFVDAVRQLHSEGLRVLGVIAGRGSQLDAMRPALAADPAFRLVDRFLTPKEVHDSFVQANVVVVPYLDATQSGVVAYAFGLGRPVVATCVGGLPEVVHDGVNGLLVPPRDAPALAAALRAVLTDAARAQAMAAASLSMGAGELSWERIAGGCCALYAALGAPAAASSGHGHA